MTPGNPKINAPGQKMAQAQDIRMTARSRFSGIRTPNRYEILFQTQLASGIRYSTAGGSYSMIAAGLANVGPLDPG
jgi:hypothetical protein